MPSFGHLDKTSHLFVHLTRPTPNSGPLRNLLPGISSYPQKLRPGGTLFFGTAKSKDRNLDRVPDRGGFRSTLKVRMHPGDLIHGVSPVGSQYGNFCPVPRDFPRNLRKTGDATHFRHGENVAAGVPLFDSRSGPMGTKLAHVQYNSSRSNFARRMSLDLRRYHPVPC